MLLGEGMTNNQTMTYMKSSKNVWSATKVGTFLAHGVRSETLAGSAKDQKIPSKKCCHDNPTGRAPAFHVFYASAGGTC